MQFTIVLLFALLAAAPPHQEMQVPRAEAEAPGVPPGTLIHRVAPILPPEVKERGLTGVVKVHCVIGIDGSVSQIKVQKSSNPIFNDPAIAAVQQWRYSPYYHHGKAVEVSTTITFNFKQ